MKIKYWLFFLSVGFLNTLVISFSTIGVELVFFTMIIPCLILLWFKYNQLSKEIEMFDKERFKRESIYLTVLDLYYLNPLLALMNSKKDNKTIEEIRKNYKLFFMFFILSFLTLIILDVLDYIF